MLGDGKSYRTRQLIRIALNEALECLVPIKHGIQRLWCSTIQCRGRLIDLPAGLWLFNAHRLTTLFDIRQLMLLVYCNAVIQLYLTTETAVEHHAQQSHVVLLQILKHISAW